MHMGKRRKQQSDERERLSVLVRATEQSPAIVLITDRAGHIEYVNHRFTQLTGFSLDEVRGKTPRVLKSGSVPTETFRELWNTILSGREWQAEILNKKRDGTFYWQRSTISAIRGESGAITHFLEVAEEITREKELESLLFQSQKMEAIGQLAGGIAHDFNNMLTVVINLGEMVGTKLDPGSELQDYMQLIVSAARKSSLLTQQLLAFSRRQLLHQEVLDINTVLGDMGKLLQTITGDNVQLVITPGVGIGSIRVDRSQVQQVILNLVMNAKQAILSDGSILVSTDMVNIAEEAITTPDHLEAGIYVCLNVQDSGCGMDKETLAHIYEPFFTTKTNGTGLGLATVYGIVNQSHGFLTVKSEPDIGTTFRIYFPVTEVETTDGQAAQQQQRKILQGTERILLVEDEEAVRQTMNRLLTTSGYSVILCANAEHAIAFCESNSEEIDLLITDVVLPRTDGIQLFGRLQELRPGTSVLYVSGYFQNQSALQHEIDAGRQYLPKPFGPTEFLEAVRNALSSRSSVNFEA